MHASYAAGTRLQAVTEHGAWCAPHPPEEDLPDPAAPRRPLDYSHDLVLIRPEGTRTSLPINRRVAEFRPGADGLYVLLDPDPGAHPEAATSAEARQAAQSWMRLPPEGGTAEPIPIDGHGAVPPHPAWRTNGFLGAGTPWHSPPFSQDPGPAAGRLRWALGCDPQDIPELRAIATGHDPHNNTETRRLELGYGYVLAAAAADPYLWITIRRRRRSDLSEPGEVELARIDTRTDRVETIHPAASIEITEHCWPLPPKPVDAHSYAEYQRRTLAEPDTVALLDGVQDHHAELVGSWPDTEVHLTLSHQHYPGLRLRKVLPLYDELGRQQPPEHVDVDLMEGFDTGHWPPASDAVRRVLDI